GQGRLRECRQALRRRGCRQQPQPRHQRSRI
ncbi:MAG: hypothetical protein AVDCRST_MAG88-2257, partial [uncultured Thermomicrobiales bacterium]